MHPASYWCMQSKLVGAAELETRSGTSAAMSHAPWLLLASVLVAAGFFLVRSVLRRVRAGQPGLKARVVGLYCFPVKSCGAVQLEKATLTACGIEHDREWVIVRKPATDECATVLTIRDYAKMVLLQPSFTASGELVLTAPGGQSVTVTPPRKPRTVELMLWRTRCRGEDQGDAVARFLTDYFGCADRPVALLRMSDTNARPLAQCHKYVHAPAVVDTADSGGVSKASDWAQFNILSTSTLAWLNRASGEDKYGALHFRPNVLVAPSEAALPFQEDAWERFAIGGVPFRFLKQTGRCQVPTVDPATGERDKRMEPLKTLMKRRGGVYEFLPRDHADAAKKEAFLAVGARHRFEPGQSLRVGDEVVVSEFRAPARRVR